jgi:signal transduction histidine kinase
MLLRAWQTPRTVLVAVAVMAPLGALAGLDDATGLTSLAVIVATYVAATSRPISTLWPALAAAAALVAAGGVVSGLITDAPAAEIVGGSVLQAVGTMGLTLLVAVIVSARREVRQARERQVEALEREQHALVQAAIARERTAMARELHDIAAHHLSGIAVMTAAIATQIDTDPAGAKEAVGQVRQQSTEVLRDLRSLVGLLREDQDPGETRPENLEGIGALVRDRAAPGLTVDLTVLGESGRSGRGIGPLAQLAAYRMVQESLTNAARHASGAAAHVVIDERSPEAVLVTVSNVAGGHRSGRGSGFGLIGMRERAELTGSTLEAGPTDDGGWQVSLRMPRDPSAEGDL